MTLLKNIYFWLILLAAGLITLSFTLNSVPALYFFVGLAVIVLVLFFIRYLEVGIYLIALLYPFNYFNFTNWGINVPYVDLLAMILFLAWGLKTLYLYFEKGQKISLKMLPAWPLALLFIASAFISLINVDREQFLASLKYVFRPIIFFYLMYVVLPYNIIDNLAKFYKTLKAMFILGIGVALMGVWSLIFPPIEGVRQAVPIAILGIYPLGTNHNLLAEVFVALIPLILILFWQEKDVFIKNIYLLGALLMVGINLLTLSRAGWLTLGLEILIFLAFSLEYWAKIKGAVQSYAFYILLVVLIPIVYLMYNLSTSFIALSSNLNRLKLMEIAWDLFKQHPFIGSGAGVFYNVVSNIKWYTIEYGSALESHGIIFKLLAEMGSFGIITFSLLVGYIIYKLYKHYKASVNTSLEFITSGCLIAVIGAIFFQIFGTNYYIANLWFPIGMALTTLKFKADGKLLPKNKYGEKI